MAELPAKASSPMRDPESPFGVGGQPCNAVARHVACASSPDLSSDALFIRQLYEQRRDLLSTHSGMTNRIKALVKAKRGMERDADVSEKLIAETDYPPLVTLLQARAAIRAHLDSLEKDMRPRAEALPVFAKFWGPVNGLGALGLALIVGEAADLANYDTHSKLWKRFGLHVGGGKAFSKRRGGLSAADWEAAGYCPRRRSIVYQIVDSLMKKKNPYRTLRDERREIERAKAKAEGLTVVPAKQIPKAQAHLYRSEGHILNRANRYVGKKLLRDLWKVWRREAKKYVPKGHASVASRSPSISAGRANRLMPATATLVMPSPPIR